MLLTHAPDGGSSVDGAGKRFAEHQSGDPALLPLLREGHHQQPAACHLPIEGGVDVPACRWHHRVRDPRAAFQRQLCSDDHHFSPGPLQEDM